MHTLPVVLLVAGRDIGCCCCCCCEIAMDERTRNLLHFKNFWRMGVLWVLSILFSHLKLIWSRFSARSRALSRPLPLACRGKSLCIVTGASSGIGKATAEEMALRGYYVVLAGRSMSRLCKVVEEISTRHSGVLLEPMELDVCSVASILEFSHSVKKLLEKSVHALSLQFLINNAGILATTERKTYEGYECMMMTNYLGHFMLTEMLIPLMQKSRLPARVVNVGSFTHHSAASFERALHLLENARLQKHPQSSYTAGVFPIAQIYESSKLFMIMFTYELNRQMSSAPSASWITATVVDPGIVQTDILRELPIWLSECVTTVLRISLLMQSPPIACKAVVHAALAPPEFSGKYFFGPNGETITSSNLSYDCKLSARLWEFSRKICCDLISEHKLLLR